jgi:hypothetical protein
MNQKVIINKSVKLINEKNKFFWYWLNKKNYVGILYFFLLGILSLVFGLTSHFTFKEILAQGCTTIYNLHFGITIGSSLIIVAIVLFRSLQLSRKYFFNGVEKYIKQVGQNGASISLNENEAIYSDNMMKQELKWERFSGFVYKKEFLVLLTGKSTFTDFIIHESELTKDEFNTILIFLKTKLRRVL